jgi:two-component system sensor histidine kinase RpfC
MLAPGKLSGAFPLIRQRFSRRLDTEHEQAFIRLVIGIVAFSYFFALSNSFGHFQKHALFVWVMVGFIAASIMLIFHIAFDPRVSPSRRLLAAALDIGAVTYFFFNAAEHALPLYFLYLWIIFGYGFRFGRRYLFYTLALSLAGFGAAISIHPYWSDNQFIGIGLWSGMLLVSLYVSSRIGHLTTPLGHLGAADPKIEQIMPIQGKLSGTFALIRQRFSGRLDTEHEQAFVRLVIGTLLFFYFLFLTLHHDQNERNLHANLVRLMVVFVIVSTMLIAHIAVYPQISPIRRLLSATLDAGTITYFFFHAAESAIPLYFLYLWIIFGYGFRFGRKYLLFTLVLSLLGFGAAVFSLEYWSHNRFLGVGLWVGMGLVSLYVNTLIGRLTAALEHAEAANQAKRRFVSSVSHELRTPLNAIIGMADLMRSSKLTHDQEDMVRAMDNASHMMLSLVEDVLDFSKIEAGKLVIENTEFDLHQLINTTVDVFKYQASERGLLLTAYIDPSVPYALRGDPHHLRQVLVNLLSNAIKFTQKGRITLRIYSMGNRDQSAQLRFEVEDTGVGIAPEAQERVFESFIQADESTTRHYGGTGLGTTISRQLVELMGGKLGLRSEVGVGSTFWFELTLQTQALILGQDRFAGLNTLLIGFGGKDAAHIGAILESVGAPCQIVDSLDVALSRVKEEAQLGNAFRFALLSADCLRGLSHAIFLPPLVKELHARAGAELFVVLCGTEGVGGAKQQIIEEAGLAAWLDLPVERRLLCNIMHASSVATAKSADVVPLAGPGHSGQAQHARYSVLVAEDNPTNRKVILKILERAGHSCALVENGEEALDLLGQQDFDVVVFDMNMPVMNGLEATKAYRFMQPPGTRIPIIMFSANVTKEAREECLAAGVDEFLPKPIQVGSFLEALDRLVKKFGANQRSRMPHRSASNGPILAQPAGAEIILNYATLAELDRIGQDRDFVDGLLIGFVADNRVLVERLEGLLVMKRFEEFKETLHAIKGSAVSIGAFSMRTTCQSFEKLTHDEMKRDARHIAKTMQGAFDKLCEAIDHYRKQREQSASKH